MYPTVDSGQNKKSAYLGANSLPLNTEQIINDSLKSQRQKANQTISLACSNLWHTFKSKLFNNYSNKGLKTLLEWIFNRLMTIAECAEEQSTLNANQTSKLSLVFELIEVVTTNSR